MAQLFPRSADTILRTAIVGGVILVCIVISTMLGLARTPYMTDEDVVIQQPIPFSHQHHVGDIGIDCRFCHQTVEFSSRASIPRTDVCMTCHRELWDQSSMLAPVRESFREGRSLRWNRVYDLPDYVYFNHAIHVHKGIGCYSCHGEVDEMPLIRQVPPLTMQWCLDCHKDPTEHVRPRELVFEPAPLKELLPGDNGDYSNVLQNIKTLGEDTWIRKNSQKPNSTSSLTLTELRAKLAKAYDVESLTDCYTCHR